MAARRTDTRKVLSNAILISGLLAVLTFATPVVASQSSSADCVELEKAGLQVPILKLAATTLGEDLDPDAATLSAQSVTIAPVVPSNSATNGTVVEPDLFDDTAPAQSQSAPAQSPTTQQIESTDRLPDSQIRLPVFSSVELQRF